MISEGKGVPTLQKPDAHDPQRGCIMHILDSKMN